ncbi:Glu-tRNA(Gln) amidotransferase subunit GatE [Candidatus Micrarchaeota archaeon]|nr:Glu-tRNA(Gln) amidotransferase subunit GatE [Candidatus Micrarchaeota archaeon]
MKAKIGIEVHQRLATERKLFCNCSSTVSNEVPCLTVKRRMRAVAGELGGVDPAAAFEMSRGREFTYQLFKNSSCLVECDEEPPHELNKEALETTLEVALLLNAKRVNELHVMRKTVVDGSAASGFQRTMLVGTDGSIKTSRGPVGILSVCLEEESAGIVEAFEAGTVYRLDRLGIPLIEIATSSNIVDGAHAREVAEKIGMLLRSTGKVQRGIGTIRQDLNISIEGGARTEIKGAQELELLPKLVDNEIRRQSALIEIKNELKKRNPGKFVFAPVDLSHAFSKTHCGILKKILERGGAIMGFRLPAFSGLLGRELMPNHRFGTELSGYAKVVGVSGLIHSDEGLEAYGFSEAELAEVTKLLSCSSGDAFILCGGERKRVAAALKAVFERALQAFEGVVKETRRAEGELSVYLRPLPGSQRMYPETDVTPIKIERKEVEEIRKKLPLSCDERKKKYFEWGLGQVLAEKMLKSPDFTLFEEIVEKTRAEGKTVAGILLESMVALRREGFAVDSIEKQHLIELFSLYKKNRIGKAAIEEALKDVSRGKSVQETIKEKNLELFDDPKLKKLVSELRSQGISDPKQVFSEMMRRYRMNVDPKRLQLLVGVK